MAENNGTTGKRRRPTSKEESEIDKVVQDLYLQGVSASFVIQTTHISKNTVYKKFKKLSKIEQKTKDSDFLQRIEDRHKQYGLFLDNLTSKAFVVLSYLEQKIENGSKNDEIPAYLLQMFSTILNNLITIGKERNAHALKPTTLEDLRKIIRDEVENENDN